jgi:hypothetical protein
VSSPKHRPRSWRFDSLEEELRQARRAYGPADANGDGVVTRKEMEAYLATQLQAREEATERLRTELARVQGAYTALETKHRGMLASLATNQTVEVPMGSSIYEAASSAWSTTPTVTYTVFRTALKKRCTPGPWPVWRRCSKVWV